MKCRMLLIFFILLLLASNDVPGKGYTHLLIDENCELECKNYELYYLRGIKHRAISAVALHNQVDCDYSPYARSDFRERVMSTLEMPEKYKRYRKCKWYKGNPEYRWQSIIFLAEYSYNVIEDPILLKYSYGIGSVFVAYDKSKDKLYCLSSFFDHTVIELYNAMIKDNPGMFNIEPICLARLLISIELDKSMIFFLESERELLLAYGLLEFERVLETPMRFFLVYKNHNYFTNLSNDSAKLGLFFSIDHSTERNAELIKKLRSYLDTNEIEFGTKVINQGETTRVELTAYAPAYSELARWAVVIDDKGYVVSLRKIQESDESLDGQLYHMMHLWQDGVIE